MFGFLLYVVFSCAKCSCLFFFPDELNGSLNEDLPGGEKDPIHCNATEQKEANLDGASLSSSAE